MDSKPYYSIIQNASLHKMVHLCVKEKKCCKQVYKHLFIKHGAKIFKGVKADPNK